MELVPLFLIAWVVLIIILGLIEEYTYSRELTILMNKWIKTLAVGLAIASVLWLCSDILITLYSGAEEL